MTEVYEAIEPGDLLRAIGSVFTVDPDLTRPATLFEGNTMVWPKGTMALVIKKTLLKTVDQEPIIHALINEEIVVALLYNFEIVRKSGSRNI